MHQLSRIREAYHVSIRRKMRPKPFLEVRTLMIQSFNQRVYKEKIQSDLTQISKFKVGFNQQFSQPQKVLIKKFLSEISDAPSSCLNVQQLLQFLICLSKFSNSACLEQRKMFMKARHLLIRFTQNPPEIVLQKMLTLLPAFLDPQMITIYQNFTMMTDWESCHKSDLVCCLCRLIHTQWSQMTESKDLIQYQPLDYLQCLLENPIPISVYAIECVVNTLQLIMQNGSDNNLYQYNLKLEVIRCVNILLEQCKEIPRQFFSTFLAKHILMIIEKTFFSLFETDQQLTMLKTIELFVQYNQIQQFFFPIVKKSIECFDKTALSMSIKIIMKLYSQRKYDQLVKHQIISKLFDLVFIGVPRWNIKFQALEVILWMLLNASNAFIIKVLKSHKCESVIQLVLREGDSVTLRDTLKLIFVMAQDTGQIYQSVIQELIKSKNLMKWLESMINHEEQQISELSLKIIELFQKKETQ